MDSHDKIAELEQRIARLTREIQERKRTEKKLRASQRQHRSLIDDLPYGIQECTLDGKITFSNRAHHRILGYPQGRLIGSYVWDFLADPQERKRLPGFFNSLVEDQPAPQPYLSRNLTRDGRVVEVQVDWTYKRDPNGNVVGFLAVITDITERQKSSRALMESESRYRSLFQNAGDAIFMIEAEGPEAGRILDANRAALQMHGYSWGELTAMNIRDIDGPQDADKVADRVERMLRGEWIKAEIVHRKKDGTLFPVELSAGVVTVGDKKVVLGIDRDITQQRAAKAALKDQIDFLQTLIDNLPTPIFYKDLNGRYLGCNKAFERFTGHNRDEIVGKTVFDIARLEIAEVFHSADQELMRTRASQSYETRVHNSNGEPRWVLYNKAVFINSEGRTGGLVGAMLDITDLKKAEAEKALLATAIEQTPEMIVMTDLKGTIHYVNPAFERVSGYGREEVIGRSMMTLRSNLQDSEWVDRIKAVLDTPRAWKGRLTNRSKGGRLFEVESTIIPVQRQPGKTTDYLMIERDITQEIYQERQLRQAQKMESIGTLAGGIAHDFNNILSAIIGFTEITLFDLPSGSTKRKYLQKVLEAGERARELVNQILTFSRSTDQEARPVVLKFIVKEALKLLKATLPSTITIRADIDSEAAILADPTQIHQVVMNLCTNAAHAMQENGGRLTLSVSEAPVSTGGPSGAGTYQRQLLLSVTDTGTGIDPEITDRIFDPFFTTKGIGEGTGMGLAVVHGIVESCGGTIQVNSQVGRGTTISITLPVIETVPAPEQPIDDVLPVGNERILFVDDEPFQVELAENILQRLGYRVTAVNRSPRALALFQAAPDDFDLVITDMTMPHMTGDALAQRLLQQRPQLPVIICTGYSQKLSEDSVRELGLAGILLKPLIMRDLATTIRKALDTPRPPV